MSFKSERKYSPIGHTVLIISFVPPFVPSKHESAIYSWNFSRAYRDEEKETISLSFVSRSKIDCNNIFGAHVRDERWIIFLRYYTPCHGYIIAAFIKHFRSIRAATVSYLNSTIIRFPYSWLLRKKFYSSSKKTARNNCGIIAVVSRSTWSLNERVTNSRKISTRSLVIYPR